MKTSVEISMYPLVAEYGTPILKFVRHLQQHEGLQVKPNTMSTQVFGDYDLVMAALNLEMKRAFEAGETVVMVMKVANVDLST